MLSHTGQVRLGFPPDRIQHFSPQGGAVGAVTFNKDIAPIIFHNCSTCHRSGESAPFSLLNYQDVKKHAKRIVDVTARRYMPPWLPEPGYAEFVGERRLSDDQISMIQQWVKQGTLEGAPSDLPQRPKFTEGWQFGRPDLVVQVPHPYTLAAEGTDVFRNFVIPVPVTSTRYVRAVEIRPGNKKIVHHANLWIDRTQASRPLDGRDGKPGFDGMDVQIASEKFDPDSHFLFWKPGTSASAEPEDMAWRLDPGTDLVLNMHLRPSGKPEVLQAAIGLYFTEKLPTKYPMLLQLEHDGAINIPPGEKNFRVTDNYELPVDVKVLGIYPHAHYLGKELQGFAVLPNGRKRWLIRIKSWDLNWQAVYRYAEPIFLAKGTTLSMRYTYDNSADNVRNPNQPPRRVVAGNKSSDEMGHLWIQVLPLQAQDLKVDPRIVLQESLMRHVLRKYPSDFTAHYNLGAALQKHGKLEEAITHLREALQIKPEDAAVHNTLGAALEETGKLEEAIGEFREALRIRPDYVNAHYNLAHLLVGRGEVNEAISHFREVLRINPNDANAHNDLGAALESSGNADEAITQFRKALRVKSDYPNAHYNLGQALLSKGRVEEAIGHFSEILRTDPHDADAQNALGAAMQQKGNSDQAIDHFREALRIRPKYTSARSNLAHSLVTQGKLDEAIGQLRELLRINPDDADTYNDLGTTLAMKGNMFEAAAQFERALRINPEHSVARANLERAKALLHKPK